MIQFTNDHRTLGRRSSSRPLATSLANEHGSGRTAIETGYAKYGVREIEHVLGDEATPELVAMIEDRASRRALAELGRLAALQVWHRDGRICWPEDSAAPVVHAVRMLVDAVARNGPMCRLADRIRDIRLGERHQVDAAPAAPPDADHEDADHDDGDADVDHLVRQVVGVIERDELEYGAMPDAVIAEALASAILVRLRRRHSAP